MGFRDRGKNLFVHTKILILTIMFYAEDKMRKTETFPHSIEFCVLSTC